MIESVFTVSSDDQAKGVEIPELESLEPFGDYFGDPDFPTEWKSPLHTGELPYINLLVWRAMQKVLNELHMDVGSLENELEAGEIRVQSRLFKSDALAITWFISSGRLEQLAQTTIKLFESRGLVVDEEDLRLDLCFKFLSRFRKKNKEESSFSNPLLPTVGVELEYGLREDPDTGEAFDSSEYQQRTNRLKPLLEAYQLKRESKSCGELSINPTASQLSQLRDVLNLVRLRHHPNLFFIPHISIGGLALTEAQREPQYIQVLILACGYSQLSTQNLEIRAQKGKGSMRFKDPIGKHSFYYLNYPYSEEYRSYYVPLVKQRGAKYEVQAYKSNNLERKTATEFRLGQLIFGFADLVREVSGIYYLSIAAIAHQKPMAERNQVEQSLAELWEKIQSQVTTMLEESGIPITESIEKSFYPSPSQRENREKAPILTDLWEIAYQSRQREVRSKYRRLLTETKHKIKMILKEEKN